MQTRRAGAAKELGGRRLTIGGVRARPLLYAEAAASEANTMTLCLAMVCVAVVLL
jgi:hypothetical protein